MSTTIPPKESKTFCILPWLHLAVLPEGSAQLCCVASSPIESNGVRLSLQTHPLEAIWNSDYMRGVRRDMASGRHVAACSHCYLKEKNGGASRRQDANYRWAEHLGPLFDALVEESRYRDYVVSELPLYYQLMPGNLCNLKCRMCFPHFSSQIERDPVHRQWVGSSLEMELTKTSALDWTKGCVKLLPETAPGLTLDGFHGFEKYQGHTFRWTNGNATLTLPLPPGIRAESLGLTLRGFLQDRHRLRLLVNGTEVHGGLVPHPGESSTHTFAVPGGAAQSLLTVQILSNTFQSGGDDRVLGVAVEKLELFHTGTAAYPRLPDGPWYRDTTWVREVLFQNANRMRGLYFTGGEPMIEPQVENVLQHLVEKQFAGNMVLELNSNCTVLRPAMLQKFEQFKEVWLGLSIDAFGPFYEYIRFPGKWAVVSRNAAKLAALSSKRFKLCGSIVVQVYNALNITEIIEFFHSLHIPCSIQFATWPSFLNIAVLPRSVRALAAGRLKAYADGCRLPEQQEHIRAVVQQIENVKDQCTPETLRTLMLFTNDLDATRSQSVRAIHGELLQLLQSEGFSWTDERSVLAAA
jgi:glutamate-1-semialdehyde 2,1-aminomutase